MGTMKEGLEDTQQAIINAARRAGRDPSEVTLVAVGKTKPASMPWAERSEMSMGFPTYTWVMRRKDSLREI